MVVGTEPVAELAGVVRERVDRAPLLEQAERPVDRGQPDVGALTAQAVVEACRGDVVVLAGELLDDEDALRRLPDAVPGEDVSRLPRGPHVA